MAKKEKKRSLPLFASLPDRPIGHPRNLVAAPLLPEWFKISSKMPTRYAANVAGGLHPHGRTLLNKSNHRCGRSCVWSEKTSSGLECHVDGPGGVDNHRCRSVRSSWPACERFEPVSS